MPPKSSSMATSFPTPVQANTGRLASIDALRGFEAYMTTDDYKAIAEKLFLSLFTVRAHIRNIYDKLHVHRKSQAVAKALKGNVVPPR